MERIKGARRGGADGGGQGRLHAAHVVAADRPAPAAAPSRDGWKIVAAALLAPLVLPMLGDLAGRHWMLAPGAVDAGHAGAVLARRALLPRRLEGAAAGSGNMDLLVALGTSAAYGLSLWLWWSETSGMPTSISNRPRW